MATTICPVAGKDFVAQYYALATAVPESYTTTTVLSTRVATITTCPSIITSCPTSAETTLLMTETLFISTIVCLITGAGLATATSRSGVISLPVVTAMVFVSPIFSTHASTLTSCPSGVSDCPASEATLKVTTETFLVGKITYTLPVPASTYPVQVLLSPLFFSSFASGLGGNAAVTGALNHHSTSGIGKSTPYKARSDLAVQKGFQVVLTPFHGHCKVANVVIREYPSAWFKVSL
ncbi:uncharacterized protein N7503_006160 [Penicillium pulvis]|uniref:uncharacterized protein n=1 Tax=Penicillium pulvis TaxID=1562058 RepID=UPI002546E186|nr:uncharacterized protein N7503_006160 [Penicillium pulvis]KAJ5798655.1 hypothetical protein N7503_006160 [Penicillium pulvis]